MSEMPENKDSYTDNADLDNAGLAPNKPPVENETENEIPLTGGKAFFSDNIIHFSNLAAPQNSSSSSSDAHAKNGESVSNETDSHLTFPDESSRDPRSPNNSPWFISENTENQDASFLSFFDEVPDDQQFQRRFQSFFQPDGDSPDADAPGFETLSFADALATPDSLSDQADAPPSNDDVSSPSVTLANSAADPSDLSEDELAQQEEEEARQENIDAAIRQNDADTLFVLGAKYEKSEEEDAPIETRGEPEINPSSILEAMIFVGNRENRPLPIAKGISLMRNVSEDEARQAVSQLNARYEKRGAPFRIEETPEGWVMNLLPDFESVRDRFFNKVKEVKLSQKAIDVLALIAYRQPISFTEIQNIRPQSGGVINLLLKRGIIAQDKRENGQEKATFYRTTPRFLTLLGIGSLDDLPIVEEVDYR